MQEGAGVRQMVEDELRASGVRLRDLDVRLELGLQESVRAPSRPATASRSSRAGGRVRPRGRHARGARVEGLDADARDLARPRRRPDARRGSPRRSSSSRATSSAVIVRWALAELGRLLASSGSSGRCSSRARAGGLDLPSTALAAWSASSRRDRDRGPGRRRRARRARRRQRDRHRQGGLRGGRPAARLGADDVLRRRVDRVLRRARRGPADARRRRAARTCTRSSTTPELTLDLPLAETVGTALNALAHCAEALYVEGHNAEADAEALAGARLIGEWLPRVVERPSDLEARTELLRGACHAGAALGKSFLALGHALAQGLGGRYGVAHGALNALTLPPALRFNEPVVGRRDRTLRRGDRERRSAGAGRGARAPRRLRAAARARYPGRRARRGRRGHRRASRCKGKSTPGHARRRRAVAQLDLVISTCLERRCRVGRR